MIKMTIDTSESKRFGDMFRATKAQVRRATRRAVKTVIKSAGRDVKREVSSRANISQKRLGVRVKQHMYNDGNAFLWFGAEPVDVASLGTIKQTKFSAKAGKVSRKGAFMAHMDSYGPKIYIRAKSAHFSADLYSETKYGQKVKKSRWGSPKSRFPLHRAVVHIVDDVQAAVDSLDRDMQALFVKRVHAELNYEVNVKK